MGITMSSAQGVSICWVVDLCLQVTVLLAQMEATGVAFDAAVLLNWRQQVTAHIQRLRSRAIKLVGIEFNLSSASQLAQVLYEHLKLPVPTNQSKF